jgi:hypothetical protein
VSRALCTAQLDGAALAKRALEAYLRLRSQGRNVSPEREELLARALIRYGDDLDAKISTSLAGLFLLHSP